MIDSFEGEYRFLSNFYPSSVRLDGVKYPTVEHAFQAAKTYSEVERTKIREAFSPGEAKKLGRRVKLRKDWEDVKLSVMEDLVRQKFKKGSFRSRLLATGKKTLVEGNWWNDTFWGVCRGRGKNHLGLILMKIRKEHRRDRKL